MGRVVLGCIYMSNDEHFEQKKMNLRDDLSKSV
jgi:hypothetical protein